MARPRGQLDRSLAALTIDIHHSVQTHSNRLSDTRTTEYEQQIHVPLGGQAADAWAFLDSKVHWELPFLYAPLQRRVPFTTPHFTHGIEFIEGPPSFVHITASVVKWAITPESWIVGATVRFGVQAPGATGLVPYGAIAHLSFQGYATSAEQGD